MRRIAIALLAAVVVLVAAAGGGYYWIKTAYYAPGPSKDIQRIQVGQGESVRTVLLDLARQGALNQPRAVELYVRILNRLNGHQTRIQAGMYEIPAGASAAQILELFDQGKVVLEQLTIIEGSRFSDLRHALDNHAAVTHTLRGKSDEEVMTALGHSGEFAEGRFLPETYRFAAKTPDVEILGLAYNAMQRLLDQAWQERTPDLPLQSPYDALTLASIVEKETGKAEERALIAGVFVRRLRIGMKLQTDPTVIYGIGDRFNGNLTVKDLRTPSAYNTYVIKGLPPTPIAMPGRHALHAALNPEDTKALYFVSRGDGSHVFSETYEQHNRAVSKYQLKGRPKTEASVKPVATGGKAVRATP